METLMSLVSLIYCVYCLQQKRHLCSYAHNRSQNLNNIKNVLIKLEKHLFVLMSKKYNISIDCMLTHQHLLWITGFIII